MNDNLHLWTFAWVVCMSGLRTAVYVQALAWAVLGTNALYMNDMNDVGRLCMRMAPAWAVPCMGSDCRERCFGKVLRVLAPDRAVGVGFRSALFLSACLPWHLLVLSAPIPSPLPLHCG